MSHGEVRILHVVMDQHFVDAGYRMFEEAYPGCNECMCVMNDRTSALVLVTTAPVRRFSTIAVTMPSFRRFLRRFDVIVFHSLGSTASYRVACVAPERAALVWIGWGYDYYGDLIERELLKPNTARAMASIDHEPGGGVTSGRRSRVRRAVAALFYRMFFRFTKDDAIRRMALFVCPLHEDYLLIRHDRPDFSPRYMAWNYESIEDDVEGFEDFALVGDDILAGNSASEENNHLDMFELLSRLDLRGRKIICPLNHGEAAYIDMVIAAGREQFGDRFIPQTEFIPKRQYVSRLASCSLAVMNHLRQQGHGNIAIMLYLGAKVFMDRANPVYTFFKNEGAVVFALEDLEAQAQTRLTKDEISRNRAVLRTHYRKEVLLQRTRELVDACRQRLERRGDVAAR